MLQRVWVLVSSKEDVGVLQQLTANEVTQGVILLHAKENTAYLASFLNAFHLYYATLLMVKMEALGTFVSCSLVIFFSPSKRRNDSKVGGAFMGETSATKESTEQSDTQTGLLVAEPGLGCGDCTGQAEPDEWNWKTRCSCLLLLSVRSYAQGY